MMAVSDGGQANRRSATSQEEATYSQIVEQFPSIYLTVGSVDGSFSKRWIGGAVAELCGYSVEELESNPELWLSFVHPADRNRVENACRDLLSGQSMREEYRIYRRDGQMKWVMELCAPPAIMHGDVVRSMRCIIDTTETRSEAQRIISFPELVDQTPTAVTVRDLSSKLIYCNRAFADLFGFDSPADALGTDFTDTMSPETSDRFNRDALPRILEGPWSGEVHVKRRDGKQLILSASTNLFRDAEGSPSAFYSILTDITQSRQTEAALQQATTHLKSVQDALAANLAVVDAEGTIVSVNERWRSFARENGDSLLSHTCEGINYLEVCRRATGDFSEGAREALAGLEDVLSGKAAEFEMEYPCPSEEHWRWFLLRATPLDEGRQGAVIAHIDVTQRKRAEEALLQSEQRYHSLVENLDAAVFRVDADMRLLTVSGRIGPMLGYTLDDFLTIPHFWQEVMHTDDLPKVIALMEETGARRTPQWVELRMRRRSGDFIWVRAALTPIFDDQGGLAYYDGVAIDITERVRSQQWEKRQMRRMAVLTELSQHLTSTLDQQQILDLATRKTCDILDCSAAGITVDPRSGRLLRMSVCCPKQHETEQMVEVLGKSDFTMENLFGAMPAEARLVPDIHRMSDRAARLADECGLGPGMIAPVVAGEETVGVLMTGRPPGEEFSEEDLWFLREIASHSSAALANAALFSRQASIAETFQRSLIPTEPSVSFLDIATFYAPAPGQIAVGGDFYDVLPIDQGKVLLVIGDVSGKGLQAAIHTAEAKYMLRAYAQETSDPLYIIDRLNAALFYYLPYESFITLACFLIDAEEGTVTYINAGHETAIVLRRDSSEFSEIVAHGPMLGVTTDVPYTLGTTTIAPGDTLFCYTDGVVDVRANGERFGYYRLRELVAEAPVEDSRELVQRVVERIHSFGQAEQTDDQVIVAVRLLD